VREINQGRIQVMLRNCGRLELRRKDGNVEKEANTKRQTPSFTLPMKIISEKD